MPTPKKFVNLHCHSHYSIFDSVGSPKDFIDAVQKSGMDSLAITDHGSCCAFSHQYLYTQQLNKAGNPFKSVYGIEGYFLPSLSEWEVLRTQINEEKRLQKKAKATEETETVVEDTEGDAGGTIIEEAESRDKNNILYRRQHLVLLAKNSQGLKDLFGLISHSNIHGYYKYPRIDFDSLQKYAKGNIIGLSACLSGPLARVVFDNQPEMATKEERDNLGPNDLNFEKTQEELKLVIDKFKEVLGPENFYLELQFNKISSQHLINMHLIEASKRTNTPLVVTTDAHYYDRSLWREREIYKMLGRQQMKVATDLDSLPKSLEEMPYELYPKNAEQMWESYQRYCKNAGYTFYEDDLMCEAIERTYDIAHNQIEVCEPDKKVKLPSIKKLVNEEELQSLSEAAEGSKEEDLLAFRELKKIAIQGLIKRKKGKDKEYVDRLKYELEVVKSLKFSKYFLTYAKLMEVIGNEMLTGAGRGSASGSLLAYVLNITQVDPIKYGLLFARFLSKGKASYPDIDSDCSDRDYAGKLLQGHFGEENVIPVSNFAQLQVVSLCKDLARIYGIPFEEVNEYTNKMRHEALDVAKQTPGFDAQAWEFTLEVAEKDSPSFNTFMEKMEQYPEFKKTLTVLFKQPKSVSRHAGGLIITNNAPDNMPLIKAKGGLQTPWSEGLNFRHLEAFGFLKFDVLGLGTLKMFENCIARILRKKSDKKPTFEEIKDWYYQNMHPDSNNFDDQEVFQNIYWNKRFLGVFQFVHEPVQNFIAGMKPTSILDIAIATSIYRPGALGAGVDKAYLPNRKDPLKIKYLHPLMNEVLGETAGCLIFQEQLQLLCNKLAGVPLEETDALRKAFLKKDISNKKKMEEDRKKLKEEFAENCLKANEIPKELSYKIFDYMLFYVSYSFNKSHAVAYAIISYMCAWLFTKYPDEWAATYIDYCSTEKGKAVGQEDPKVTALNEACKLGYTMGKPDINTSEYEFLVHDKTLIPSFASLKYVGKSALSEIEKYRPYKTIEDLFWNINETWKHSKLNKRAIATLIKLEAFDSMGVVGPDKTFKNYKQMYNVIVEKGDLIKSAFNRKKQRNHKELLKQFIEEAQSIEDWPDTEKLAASKELAGFMDMNLIVTPEIKSLFTTSNIQTIDAFNNPNDFYWAIIKEANIGLTKTKKLYLKLRITSEAGKDSTCFVWNYKQEGPETNLAPNDIIIGRFEKSDWGGFKTYQRSIRKVS